MRTPFLAALLLTTWSGCAMAQSALTPVDNSVLSQTSSGPAVNYGKVLFVPGPDGTKVMTQVGKTGPSTGSTSQLGVSTVSGNCTMANCGQPMVNAVQQAAAGIAAK
jgi:hypothetical protein